MGALAHLLLSDAYARVPVGVEHRLFEALEAIGVGSLADDEEGRALVVGHVAVERGQPGVVGDGSDAGREIGAPLDDVAEVFGRRAAAAADDRHAHLGDEPGVELGEFGGREVVVHLAVDHRRQAGVGQTADRDVAVGGEVAEVLAHLPRPGSAVEAEDVGTHGCERGDGRARLGAGEHATGLFDGDLHLDGNDAPGGRHRPSHADHGRLGLQQVLHGLDDEEIDTAGEEAAGGDLVAVAHRVEANPPERRHRLVGRPERAGHEPVVPRRHLTGDLGRDPRQFFSPGAQPVLVEGPGQGAEGIGFDHIDTDLEERSMEVGDHVRT